MIHVRRHKRVTESGRTVTVRSHEREGDAPDGMMRRPDDARGWQVPPPAAAAPPADEDLWADDAEPDDESPSAKLTPAEKKLFGADTPQGAARYDRASRLRDSGWAGPIDQDGNKVESGPEFDILQRMQRTSPRETLRAARQALEENGRREKAAGIDWETDEYLRLNDAVLDAEQGVSWWHR